MLSGRKFAQYVAPLAWIIHEPTAADAVLPYLRRCAGKLRLQVRLQAQ